MSKALLEARIATLEAELAASREDAKLAWAEASMGPTEAAITHELAQSQAHANALRDALEEVLHNATCACYEDGEPGHCPRCAVAYQEARTALLATPAQSLAAHDAEVLEPYKAALRECIEVAEAFNEAVRKDSGRAYPWPAWDQLRYRLEKSALAAQAATHSVPDGTSEVKP